MLNHPDGVRVAEISCVLGLLDTSARWLLADPRGTLGELALRPELLGGTFR